MTDREIYEQVREPLMRFAASLVGPDDAHDVVSDAVVATLRRHRLSDLDSPKSYLMTAVLNHARTRGRRLSRERAAVSRLSSWPEPSEPSGAEPDVELTVRQLPVQQRAAIYLVYWEDMSPSQAAEAMGVRPGTVRRYLHLARNKLKAHLDE